MSEITERVGKAVMALLAEVNPDGVWGNYDQVGRAAIEAMREPTEAMVDETATGLDSEGYGLARCDVKNVWRQMIDAALKDS